MLWTKLPRYFVALSSPLLLALAMLPGFLTTARAQTKRPTQTTAAPKQNRVIFEPRKDQPAPTISLGGGTRSLGNCDSASRVSGQPTQSSALAQNLNPLLPSPSTKLQLTASAHPTFLVYVPRTSAKAMEFVLFADNSEKEIYQTTLNLTGTPGIVSISVPSTTPALEMGKDYRWIVTMACPSQSEESAPEDPYVQGLVRRIQSDSSLSQLDKAKPLDRVALYAKSGFWYEAVANLAALRKAQPSDPEVASAWKDLLQSAGLEAIANVPLKN